MTLSAAPLSAAAQSEEIFGFLPFVARVAFASAFLSAIFALSSSPRAFFPEFDAARSMRFSAFVSFAITPAGMA